MKPIFNIDYKVKEKWKSKVELSVFNDDFTTSLEQIITSNKVVVRTIKQGTIYESQKKQYPFDIYVFSIKEWDKIRCHFFTDDLSQIRNQKIDQILE
jgi:hypothetical protein